jgi:hypothetical protein
MAMRAHLEQLDQTLKIKRIEQKLLRNLPLAKENY